MPQRTYVLAVAVKEPLCIGFEQYRADEVAAQLEAADWHRAQAQLWRGQQGSQSV